ncbi:hypothetical protein VP01_9174g1, partial [Puccinia sorghi]
GFPNWGIISSLHTFRSEFMRCATKNNSSTFPRLMGWIEQVEAGIGFFSTANNVALLLNNMAGTKIFHLIVGVAPREEGIELEQLDGLRSLNQRERKLARMRKEPEGKALLATVGAGGGG